MLKVQATPCATCIYRADSALDIDALEAQIADPRMAGFFVGSRICHHSTDAVCNGFWVRHKDHYAAGQIAQRLKFVEFVHHDTLATRPRRARAFLSTRTRRPRR